MTQNYILPPMWESQWEPERVVKLKKLIADFRYTFAEHGYDCAFLLAYRQYSPYISMGCRPKRKQPNGNLFSMLMAFGFFYDHGVNRLFDKGTDRYVEHCIAEYEQFIDGKWPITRLPDQDIVDRVEASAKKVSLPLFDEVDPLS